MIRTATRREAAPATETGEKSDTRGPASGEIALYCVACKSRSNGWLQSAQDILTNGFRDRHYRYHVKTNNWDLPDEYVEGDCVDMVDKPCDPATTTGVQIEVILPLAEVAPYEMPFTSYVTHDWTGETFRRNRQFLVPAQVLNERGHVRVIPPDEAYEKCDWRTDEADERGRRRKIRRPAP